MEKYVIFNYEDLTDLSKENVSKGSNWPINILKLKKGKTGYIINKRPI